MPENKKSYYAIIPANVRYDKRIRANAKLLYGEITALTNEKGYCWANNQYFADLYEVSKETISRWVSELSDRGYITVELIYKEGSNQIINRYIRISHDPIDEKVNTPIDEKVKDNTTSFNTTKNTKYIEQSSVDDLSISKRFEEIWKDYPNKQGKKPAFSSYKTALKNGTTDKDITEGLERYKRHLQKNTWKQAAQGSTWFRQNRWEDEFDDVAEENTTSAELSYLDEL